MQKICLLPWPDLLMFSDFRKRANIELPINIRVSFYDKYTTLYFTMYSMKEVLFLFKTTFLSELWRRFLQFLGWTWQFFYKQGLSWFWKSQNHMNSWFDKTRLGSSVSYSNNNCCIVCIFVFRLGVDLVLPLSQEEEEEQEEEQTLTKIYQKGVY